MKTILLAEDQQIVRQGLKMMIEHRQRYQVIEAENGQEAVDLAGRHVIDLVLMDVRMPVMTGIEATKRLIERDPNVKIVMLTTFIDERYAIEALKAGAKGYILKDADMESLFATIEKALLGELVLDGQVAAKVMPKLLQHSAPQEKEQIPPLAEREKEIIRLVGQGRNNAEIAAELYLSVGTVKNYISQLFIKLGVRDRTQLAIFAVKHDI
ncbi:response regulator transcription factor [Shouchella clausii]|uniref:Two-component response regulator n=3 Tax=Shouchella TaxID=2893057 RepID=Q5WJ71_SHOC1|nr:MULTISPECIES: response regulator transcription factor [Shouchella]MCM3311729.1 response regulator transcription factor [Psychrobacillus sp. MER TA 17]PAD43873.1 DNA-binding response regulator [Bacillus sp. 7520-S]ALA51769.1 two-component response regulator [Shouchella clausii]AST94622.1 DNA-binding response regulator [Shouchella clausii]MBU3232194.1 response regulator transcription factor [Shouchella clausii]